MITIGCVYIYIYIYRYRYTPQVSDIGSIIGNQNRSIDWMRRSKSKIVLNDLNGIFYVHQQRMFFLHGIWLIVHEFGANFGQLNKKPLPSGDGLNPTHKNGEFGVAL